MLTIGMLGGMSWESSAQYYRLANELVRERLGGLHSARLVLLSVDFAEIEMLQATGAWNEAGELLAKAAKQVRAAGADLLLLCTNTMHKVADQVAAAVDIPLLHLADTTAAAVQAAELTRVGLLGTAFTMEQSFYRERLAAGGITVLVPEATDRGMVHSVIYDELCLGVVSDASRTRYLTVIDALVAAGAEGIVLGCTEIELLIAQDDSPGPIFPTSRLHVEAAVGSAGRNLMPLRWPIHHGRSRAAEAAGQGHVAMSRVRPCGAACCRSPLQLFVSDLGARKRQESVTSSATSSTLTASRRMRTTAYPS